MKYGTRAWLEAQYEATSGDPWGLDWRRSQQFRYAHMVSALEHVAGANWRAQNIIDVGCATGSFTSLIATLAPAEGASVIGVDIAESAVARASRRFPSLRFERMSITECATHFGDSADLVTCLEVLYYLPTEERPVALRALRQLLRPDGLLLVSSMISTAPYFSPDELKGLVESEFQIVHSGTLHLKPLVLWEKIGMRLRGTTQGTEPCAQDIAKVAQLNSWSHRFLGSRAASHAFVIARPRQYSLSE